MVGLPRVPDDAWIRTVSASGTASVPNGYWSRSSALKVKGSDSSAPPSTPSSFRCQYGLSEPFRRGTSVEPLLLEQGTLVGRRGLDRRLEHRATGGSSALRRADRARAEHTFQR